MEKFQILVQDPYTKLCVGSSTASRLLRIKLVSFAVIENSYDAFWGCNNLDLLTKYYSGEKIKKDGIGGARSTYGEKRDAYRVWW